MTRWGWIGLASGTVVAAGVGLAFSGAVPSYSATFGLFPTTAAGFKGNATLMRQYVARHRLQTGVDTPQNALAWQLYDDLAGTQFGYVVSGIQHTQTGNTVSNTLVPIPSGATVTYATLGANPFQSGQVVIGKYANGVLWQVYSQAGSLPATTST